MSAPQRSSTARGLGAEHRKQRERLLRDTPEGTPCEECLEPMHPKTRPGDLDADHTVSRAEGGKIADRLLHSWCNRRRGDGTRRPLSTITSRQWFPEKSGT